MILNHAPRQPTCTTCNPDRPSLLYPPVSAQCGHPMCIECNPPLIKCPVCSVKYSLQEKVAFVLANMPEEKVSSFISQQPDNATKRTGLAVCCDCWVTFDFENITVLGETHEDHSCVKLNSLTTEMQENLLWVCQKLHKGHTTLESVKSTLQVLITLTLEVQKAFWEVFGSLHSKGVLMSQLKDEFMGISGPGMMDPQLENGTLFEALRTLRNFEVHMAGPILKIVQGFGPATIKTRIEDSLISDLSKAPQAPYGLASVNPDLVSKLPRLTDYAVRLDLSKPIFEQIENLRSNAKTALREKNNELNMKTLGHCTKSPRIISVEGLSTRSTEADLELLQELEAVEKSCEKSDYLGKR